MLHVYLCEELEVIGNRNLLLCGTPRTDKGDPKWTDKKTGLIELIYGIDTLCSMENGNISLRKRQEFFKRRLH